MIPEDIFNIIRDTMAAKPENYAVECASIIATALRNGKWLRSHHDDARKIYDIMYDNEIIASNVFDMLMEPSKIESNVLLSDVDFIKPDIMGDNGDTIIASSSSCCIGSRRFKY